MGKKVEYSGSGEWKFVVKLPEPLARRVLGLLNQRGVTCTELARTAIADYVDVKLEQRRD